MLTALLDWIVVVVLDEAGVAGIGWEGRGCFSESLSRKVGGSCCCFCVSVFTGEFGRGF